MKAHVKRAMVMAMIGVAAAVALMAQPYRLIRFTGRSMQPTYEDGAFALIQKNPTRVERGDIVIFEHDGETYVKRVTRMEGEWYTQIKIHNKEWVEPARINGLRTAIRRGWGHRVRQVPPGHVFVRGDNLAQSADSRKFGAIPLSAIKAIVVNPRETDSTLAAGTFVRNPTELAAMASTPI